MSQEKPSLNQIIFIDLGYSDEWDKLEKGRPCVITGLKEKEKFLFLRLLVITSQDESQIKEKEKQFISQYEIRRLPDCLRINPSFVRIHRQVNLKITKSKLIKLLCDKCSQGCFKKFEKKKETDGEVENEYDFFVKKHEDYRTDKLNASKLRPPIEIEID